MKDSAAVRKLDGTSVLVASARDRQNPPVGLRGTLEVKTDASHPGDVAVDVKIEIPDMFTASAHSHRIPLDEKAIEPLFEAADSEHPGMRTIMIDDPF